MRSELLKPGGRYIVEYGEPTHKKRFRNEAKISKGIVTMSASVLHRFHPCNCLGLVGIKLGAQPRNIDFDMGRYLKKGV
jgi:hypothetical protein